MGNIKRHDLKKNELAEIVIKTMEWVKANRQIFLSISGLVVVAIAFSVFFYIKLSQLEQRAIDKLAFAQGQLYQGNTAQAIQIMDEVIATNTDSSAQARISKSDLYVSQGDLINAEEVLKPLLVKGKPKSIVPLAILHLGVIQENQGKFDDAISTYNKFLEKYSEHFLAPISYESLARLYEIKGDIVNAKANHERLSTLYPVTGYAKRAQERLTMLSQMQAR